MQQTKPEFRHMRFVQLGVLVLAALGIVVSIIGAIVDIDRFFQVYLVAYLFCLQFSLGCLGMLMLTTIVHSRWGFAVQRIAAAGARTIPLMAVLLIPILLRLDVLYPWAQDGVELSGNKGDWLDPGFVVIRTIVYFLIWTGLAYGITLLQFSNDEDGAEGPVNQSQRLAIIGFILFMLTVTFASFDWVMSLNKDFTSSIFGWLMMAVQGVSAFAFVIIMLSLFWNRAPLKAVTNTRATLDLATLLLVSIMTWIYMNAMQYIIIWSGNSQEKGTWFEMHTANNWEGLVFFIALVHAVMFVLLVIPGLKYVRQLTVAIAVMVIFMRLVDMFWTVMPHFTNDFVLEWWDFGLVLALGGAWMVFFLFDLSLHKLVADKHPEFEHVMTYHEHGRGEVEEGMPSA